MDLHPKQGMTDLLDVHSWGCRLARTLGPNYAGILLDSLA